MSLSPNELVMFTNLAEEEENFLQVLFISSYVAAFCEFSIAVVISLSSK